MKRGMKYDERTIRLTKLQILFSKSTHPSTPPLGLSVETPLKESKKDEYHKDTYKLQIKVITFFFIKPKGYYCIFKSNTTTAKRTARSDWLLSMILIVCAPIPMGMIS